jgi:hypothetical protein
MRKVPKRPQNVAGSMTVHPAGHDARLFNDHLFSRLRALAGVPADFVDAGWSLQDLEPGGAKGGCPMAFVGSEYVVKELCLDDHESLLEISKSYFEHVCDGDTLLATIYLHFEDLASGRYFLVMRNITGSGPFLAKYDLKGCNDDKTLELLGTKVTPANPLMSEFGCWFNSSPSATPGVDIMVTEGQRAEVLHRMHRDAKWLTSNQLMDYSLIVAAKAIDPGLPPEGCFGQAPLIRRCVDGSEVAVHVGIIDFLQKWNLKKRIARRIKFFELNKATVPPARYAQRFCAYFEDRIAPYAQTHARSPPTSKGALVNLVRVIAMRRIRSSHAFLTV